MGSEHAYAYESGYQDGLRAASQIWHRMADVRPQNPDARYLLLGNGGGMYVGTIREMKCHNGSMLFHIPNHRVGFMGSERVKAWAEIPECGLE